MMKPRPEGAADIPLLLSLMAGRWFGFEMPKSAWLGAIILVCATAGAIAVPGDQAGDVVYTNIIVSAEPWSIHVIKIPRSNATYEIRSRHAGEGALGMSPLSEHITGLRTTAGKPVAAINGGFYRRDKAYAGAARGLQIVDGEILSAPNGGPCFWMDVGGGPHIENIMSQFQIIWPDGRNTTFELNSERGDSSVVLYTPAMGTPTFATNGIEFVLEKQDGGRWLPLRAGRALPAKVKAVQQAGNPAFTPGTMIVSVGGKLAEQFRKVQPGDTLQISTATSPSLSVARNALAAGPVLVRNGRRQKISAAPDDAYESSSMIERHPRSAIGWNTDWYFLVVADGRQRDVSDGMTLEELGGFLARLGCEEALNLDGGGSSTLWFDGSVRNNPCDGYERPIATSLVVVKKETRGSARP